MQRVIVALALGSAAAFAPAAQPRASVVRFMDEDALKSAASVVLSLQSSIVGEAARVTRSRRALSRECFHIHAIDE